MNEVANPIDPELPWFSCESFDETFYDEAPQIYVNVVELGCTPDQLFDVFEDPESWPVWAKGIGKVIWTSGMPYGVGTTRTVVFWGGTRVYETFTAWERGREMAFQFVGHTEEIWTRFGEHYLVTPVGEGRCRLRWTVAYEPAGGFARAHALVRPSMVMGFKLYMVLLKRYCRRLG